MEKNTVLLDLNEYNQLRDFKKAIEDGNTIHHSWNGKISYITTDEAVKLAIEESDGIVKLKIEQETKDVKFYQDRYFEVYNKVKRMSIWEFYKWRSKQ